MNPILNKKVATVLDRGLAAFKDVEIRLDEERGTAFHDVFGYPGIHDGKEWEILIPVGVGDDAITVEECCIHSSAPGMRDYTQVSNISDAVRNGVPTKVIDHAKEIARAIQKLDLPLMALDDPGKVLLDMLEAIVEAQAEGDEDKLHEAMAAARESVVTYRPWISINLEDALEGTGRAP